MKLMMLAWVVLCSLPTYGQKVTTEPAILVADQEITIHIDVTGTSLEGYEKEVWLWTWIAEDCNSGCDAPTNIDPATANADDAKMVRDEINKDSYSLTFTPTTFFGKDASELKKIGVKAKSLAWDDNKQSDHDVLITMAQPGELLTTFISPNTKYGRISIAIGDTLEIKGYSSLKANLSIKVGNSIIVSGSNLKEISHQYIVTEEDPTTVSLTAKSNNLESLSQFIFFVAPTPEEKALPQGIVDGINYPVDSTKVILSLLAPGKDFVYVIGDFNDWQPKSNYLMKQTPDKERFWLEIENLEPGKEYIYQYLIDGVLPIADPYTEKVSNPNDDKFISEVTYPNLIQYPEGKTQYRASVLQTNQKTFEWKVKEFPAPEPQNLIIYELLIRDFNSLHSYKAVRDSLDYLLNLGINAIELMPVNEFEGNLSWGYNPNFYFAPDKYYGPKEELKKLIDTAHEKGIAVIIDLVLNHSFNSSPMVRMYWNVETNKPSNDNPWYNVNHNFDNTAAHWGTDFNHESTYTQDFIDRVNRFWIEEYKVDGFRFDFTKGFSNKRKPLSDPWGSEYDSKRVAILKRMVDKIREVDEDNIIIFEHLADNVEEKELADYGILLWGNMNHQYRNLVKGGNDDLTNQDYQKRNWKEPNLIAYMESHDEERLMFEAIENGNQSGDYNLKDETTALNRLKMEAAFYFTFPGPKMIWQFGEYGYDIPIDFNGRTGEKPIKWEYLDNPERLKLFKVYAALIKSKKENSVFNTTSYSYSLDQPTKWIKLSGDDMNLIIVGNFGLETKGEAIEFPNTGKWFDFFTGKDLEINEKMFVFTLEPGQFHILTDKAIDFPEKDLVPYSPNLVTGLEEFIEEVSVIEIYPNPVKDSLFIYLKGKAESKGKLKLFDLTGKEVWTSGNFKLNKKSSKKVNIPYLDTGMYFLIFHSDKGDYLKSKIIIE